MGVYEKTPGSGVWYVLWYDDRGRRHREKVGPKNLAEKVYNRRKGEAAQGKFFPEARKHQIRLKDYIKQNVALVKRRVRNTYVQDLYAKYWTHALGEMFLRQIEAGDISRHVAKRAAKVSGATINRELAFLSRVFNAAVVDGYVDANPVKLITRTKEAGRLRYLTEKEEKELRKFLRPDFWDLVQFAIHTGMRQSEQFKLKWVNVDLAAGFLFVPVSKHGGSRRVPLNDTSRAILQRQPSRMKGEFVFTETLEGRPRNAKNFTRRTFANALLKAKIDDFRWHDLRHTCGSRLAMAGADIRLIQEMLGHKTLEQTRKYAHLSPSHMSQTAKLLDVKKVTAPVAAPGTKAVAKRRAQGGRHA